MKRYQEALIWLVAQNWRRIVFWGGLAAFTACMAWTILGK